MPDPCHFCTAPVTGPHFAISTTVLGDLLVHPVCGDCNARYSTACRALVARRQQKQQIGKYRLRKGKVG